jgi:hypothetical protein
MEGIDPKAEREAGALMSFDDVQEALVEAVRCTWRLPDRERGWHQVRSLWPAIRRHTWFGDYGESASDAPPAPLPLSRREIAQMERALGWVEVVQGDDRRLIGLALRELARGEARVPWRRLLRPMGLTMGSDGLRMRYARAMRLVVCRANGANPGRGVSRGLPLPKL